MLLTPRHWWPNVAHQQGADIMRIYIKGPIARKIHYEEIAVRRRCNAMARSRGFHNYAEMCGEDD